MKNNAPINQKIPLYQKIKDYILEHIATGDWPPSARVPSENELVQHFKVSRMTTNRALKELTEEGYLVRMAGVGSFVADLKAQSHPLEIHNIADEIRGRGHDHSAHVLTLEQVGASAEIAGQLKIATGAAVFHSLIRHEEQNIPIQIEDRFVNRVMVPNYGAQDFSRITPYEYLIRVAPLQKVEHVVQAIMPRPEICKHLHMAENEPCLLIKRRTWTEGQVASTAMLYHPGSRYALSGRFKP